RFLMRVDAMVFARSLRFRLPRVQPFGSGKTCARTSPRGACPRVPTYAGGYGSECGEFVRRTVHCNTFAHRSVAVLIDYGVTVRQYCLEGLCLRTRPKPPCGPWRGVQRPQPLSLSPGTGPRLAGASGSTSRRSSAPAL